ncbi:Forkhead box protein N1 [Camponotus japonicus]
MELDTVNAYSTIGMEQGLSGDPWDCLFGSDSISDAFQGRPDMFHMDIRRCDNTGRIGWHGPGLGFDFEDVLETEDPVGFNDKSRSSNSNLEELNLDSDSELALTLDPNLILPRNMCMPIRSPASNSEAAMLETASVEENVVENEGEETENESEVERTENDEENESEEEEEEEEEIEEHEHNETEYEETEEEETEEEEEEEEETEDDEQQDAAQRLLAPSNVETPTSISSSSSSTGVRTTVAASSSPTIQLTRVQMQHPKMGTVSGTMDIKMLTSSPGSHIRKQIYNNNVHDVSPGATTTVMIQAAKREKDLTGRDNPYPKPAYSYSCLIAMALKNSQTGLLPVSEIYNFMCRHFPYFKTAPTGWKNSVRHNLSLNKCFEKIEKPPGNGSQRKGCLWAIHPSKVAKMDEEVRKWSRKDPIAIKRAMVHPDHLELLERGEMKYEGDRHEEIYEDAESYAGSETGGSAADEIINDDENVTYDESKHIDIVDDDIVVGQLYEGLDLGDAAELLDTRLTDFPREEQSFVYEYVSCAKRQKTASLSSSPIQSKYVYQQVSATSPRKKSHLVALRPGTGAITGSLLEAD